MARWRLLDRVMWGKRKKRQGRVGAFLDEGSEIEGKYTCAGTVMLDAKVRGEVVSTDTLIIGERGAVHAAVHAVTLVVRGEVVGSITASERVELKCGARVVGDIEAPVIVMEEGAMHDGNCRMVQGEPGDGGRSVVVPIKA